MFYLIGQFSSLLTLSKFQPTMRTIPYIFTLRFVFFFDVCCGSYGQSKEFCSFFMLCCCCCFHWIILDLGCLCFNFINWQSLISFVFQINPGLFAFCFSYVLFILFLYFLSFFFFIFLVHWFLFIYLLVCWDKLCFLHFLCALLLKWRCWVGKWIEALTTHIDWSFGSVMQNLLRLIEQADCPSACNRNSIWSEASRRD